ncbi:prealbumin-like fold domain-containing protein [Lentzea sp. NPDC003310]|uniref:prealbumin-like fold domain-containing protein n=1 Tax=Lentzea sp. NPDC003310 TaxID=3154447 RepID=UPI0033B89263
MTRQPVSDWETSYGYISMYCSVGGPYPFNSIDGITALARSAGPVASRVDATLVKFRYKPLMGLPSGDPLPGVKIYLRDRLDHDVIVASDVSGENGRLTFHNLRPGLYRVGVVGSSRIPRLHLLLARLIRCWPRRARTWRGWLWVVC